MQSGTPRYGSASMSKKLVRMSPQDESFQAGRELSGTSGWRINDLVFQEKNRALTEDMPALKKNDGPLFD